MCPLDVALFRSSDSIILFAGVLAGGAYGIQGALLAAVFVKVVPAVLDQVGINADYALLLFGIGILQVLLASPTGWHAAASGPSGRGVGQEVPQTTGPYSRTGGSPMIAVEDLTVRFGGVRPIDGLTVSFNAPVCGLIGPNGAGKTTLLDVLSGFVRPESGEVTLASHSLRGKSARRRAKAGLRRSFQRDSVVERLNAHENVELAQEHLGRSGPTSDELLEPSD